MWDIERISEFFSSLWFIRWFLFILKGTWQRQAMDYSTLPKFWSYLWQQILIFKVLRKNHTLIFPNCINWVCYLGRILVFYLKRTRIVSKFKFYHGQSLGMIKKYNFVNILGEKFTSKSDCRKLRSANVLVNKLFFEEGSLPQDNIRPCR